MVQAQQSAGSKALVGLLIHSLADGERNCMLRTENHAAFMADTYLSSAGSAWDCFETTIILRCGCRHDGHLGQGAAQAGGRLRDGAAQASGDLRPRDVSARLRLAAAARQGGTRRIRRIRSVDGPRHLLDPGQLAFLDTHFLDTVQLSRFHSLRMHCRHSLPVCLSSLTCPANA